MRIKTLFIISLLSSLLISCVSYDLSRKNVQQGNLLPMAKINKLSVGMSKQDTAILMGSSLLSPTFNNNRWDYAYTFREGSNTPVVRHLSIYFNNNRISGIEHQP